MEMEFISQSIVKKAEKATDQLLPVKSRAVYDREYKIFVNWKAENSVTSLNEVTMLAYFQELSEKYAANSLWTKYSILKATLDINENTDISKFTRLLSFIKRKSKGYLPKKSKVLTGDQVLAFIKDAPDETFLLHKVVLVMGVFGALRRDEMVKMTIDDIDDKGPVILVKVPETKTGEAKGFTIVEEENIGALKLFRQYAALRPGGMKERRFFLTYRNNRCTVQPVGKNTLGGVPTVIARYLKLNNAKEYTGHCLRRTSSTLLVEAGASFETLKLHGKWKSTTVAEGYIAESVVSKNRIANMIAGSVSGSSSNYQNQEESANTFVDFHDQSPAPTGDSIVCDATKNVKNSSLASFPGTFYNCQFNFGK